MTKGKAAAATYFEKRVKERCANGLQVLLFINPKLLMLHDLHMFPQKPTIDTSAGPAQNNTVDSTELASVGKRLYFVKYQHHS